jgi:Spy/CpxP family protein refolding chaperone
MRFISVRALAFGAAVLLALPLSAQAQQPGGRGGRGGFGGQQDPSTILLQKPVQEELKLSDAQKTDLQKIQESRRTAMQGAFQPGGDREKAQEAMKTIRENTKKELDKVSETLKPEQKKRLKQLEIQFAGFRAFAQEDVQKELNLTDKQKTEVKELGEGVAKDVQELFAGAQGDREKMREMGKKVQAVSKEAMEKVSGLLTDDQKKSWSTMVGEKFDKFEQMGGFGGRRPGNQNQQQPGNSSK